VLWKPAETTRGQIVLLHMDLFCFRQVSNRFGHVSVTWKEQCAEQPGARRAWPLPPASALPSPPRASGGRCLSRCPRERPWLCPSLPCRCMAMEKRGWLQGHPGLLLARRAVISASQQAHWLPSFDVLHGVQLESSNKGNDCQRFLTCLKRAVFSSGLEIVLNQAIFHEADVSAITVYLHMLFGASRSPAWC